VVLGWVKNGNHARVTVFSPSARTRLEKLRVELGESFEKQIEVGFSPWEGRWKSALEQSQPDFFVTVKYEAWPDLWASLAEKKIPLIVVGAELRSSLIWAKRVCRLLGSSLPDFQFLLFDQASAQKLSEVFSSSRIQWTGDPRWDRVKERSLQPSTRVQLLLRRTEGLSFPRAIFGNIWPEDVKALGEAWLKEEGTLFFVPHRVDASSVQFFVDWLESKKVSYWKSSAVQASAANPQVILVDEMGFLSELYSSIPGLSFVYVGGGLGRGVHSTIEPAISGVPIAIGPQGSDRFTEITQLKQAGQLRILRQELAAKDWAQWRAEVSAPQNSSDWRKEIESRYGATQRVLSCLLSAC
jgi:3-deoxy-D-manno-octulosonic-acid transferase